MKEHNSSSNGNVTHVLTVVSKCDHWFSFPYTNADKARTAALGFLKAMRESSPESVAALWTNGTMCTFEGVTKIQVPVFSIRAGEIGSVSLRNAVEFGTHGDDDESEVWKS